MSNPKRANDMNMPPCYKVRLAFRGGGMAFILSKTEPVLMLEKNRLVDCIVDIIEDTEHGDNIGYIEWREVDAIIWRFAPLATAKD